MSPGMTRGTVASPDPQRERTRVRAPAKAVRSGFRLGRLVGQVEVTLALWGFGLNVVWEYAHSPLYADHTAGWWHVVGTRLPYAGADVVILLVTYWLTSMLLGTRRWLSEGRVAAATGWVLLTFGYSAWSEWFNTDVLQTWAYGPGMPTVFGIGLTPLAQWVVIPTALCFLIQGAAPSRVL